MRFTHMVLRRLAPALLVPVMAVFPFEAGAETADSAPLQLAVENSDGFLQGSVKHAAGAVLVGAKIQLSNTAGKVVAQTQSDSQGHFNIAGIAPGIYTVAATKAGAGDTAASVTIVSGQPSSIVLELGVTQLDAVVVTARRFERARNALSPSTGSSQYTFTAKAVEKLPEGDHTSFNKVLLQAPGVANDSFGQLHVRGDHGDLQYRLNGIILPEGISGFGQVLDPRFASSITLNTGALPAQYGLRTAGVVDIITKQKLNGGTLDVYGGSHNTINPSFQIGQSGGNFTGYATGQYLQSNLGVENPTDKSNAIHDSTVQGKGFAYGSYLLDTQTKLSAVVAATSSRLEIPNNPNQSPNPDNIAQLQSAGFDTSELDSARLDERQFERNVYGLVALQGMTDNELTYQLAAYSRQSAVEFKPDVLGDLAFNGVASKIKRKASTSGLQGDLGYSVTDAHRLSIGFSASTEDDRADNSSQVFTTDANGKVNGGPVTIVDNNPKNGNTLVSLYLQDKWDLSDQLTVNYGLRYDKLNAFVEASQFSPRLGFIDYLTPRTTIHAGYARYFTPPPNELVASASIARFANTSNAPQNLQNSSVQPERAHYFDAGFTHQLTSAINVGLDSYYRYARNLLDEGQFGQALIFTPFNYQQGHVYGLEFTSSYNVGNFNSYLNVARSVTQATRVASGEFNFGQDELSYIGSHYIYLDHDQRLTISSGASYTWFGTTFGVASTYGSGLRKGFSNTEKLRPNLQIDLAATRKLRMGKALGDFDLRLAVLNVLDRSNPIRDGSGIGVGAPQFGPRAAVYVGVGKSFGGS